MSRHLMHVALVEEVQEIEGKDHLIAPHEPERIPLMAQVVAGMPLSASALLLRKVLCLGIYDTERRSFKLKLSVVFPDGESVGFATIPVDWMLDSNYMPATTRIESHGWWLRGPGIYLLRLTADEDEHLIDIAVPIEAYQP